jgi:uncharacterized protein (DUF924 family)
MVQYEEILKFWFGSCDEADYGKPRQFWFNPDPQFDREVRNRFQTYYELAASGN